MVLYSDKIILRAVQPADAEILYTWENDSRNWDVSGTRKPFSKKEIKDFIANQKDIYLDRQLRWMVCLPHPSSSGNAHESEAVGCIDLFDFDGRKASIGVLIAEECRKKGYGSGALSLLIRYSFEVLHLRQLLSSVSADNTASMKLFLKHNFTVSEKNNDIYLLELKNKLS